MREKDKQLQDEKRVEQSRRDFLKGSGVVAGGLAAAAVPGLAEAAAADARQQDTAQSPPSKNPYGKRPGGGISLPEYYKPWPAIKNRNMYLPGTEILPKNEMRVSSWEARRGRQHGCRKARPFWSSLGPANCSRADSSSIWATAVSATR